MIASRNPATGDLLKEFAALTPEETLRRVELAAKAFKSYRTTSFAERAEWLRRAATILEERQATLAELMTVEMGKTRRSAAEEVLKCVRGCRYYADHAERFLAEEVVAFDGARASVRYQPVGTVLAIMPWNFPFWQVFRFAAPALMAGNTALLKHASNVPQCSLAIEQILEQAGFPSGVFQSLLIGPDEVESIIAHPSVAAVTLTGSVGAGSRVAAIAGKHLKKTVLELGGSDPFIVLPSANLQQAAEKSVQARIINNGQSCIAAKRFIVADPIADAFEKEFVRKIHELQVGDPMLDGTQVGPLATNEVREGLEKQVAESIARGATVLTGGRRTGTQGYYYEPTVLSNIPKDCPAYREELFGPVASLFRVPGVEAAIELANDTSFGLGASVWTEDAVERERCLHGLDAGMVFVNGMVASDPRLPFGGVKESGYGRELGAFGIREFVNIKTTVVK